jgi:hypothetical protein
MDKKKPCNGKKAPDPSLDLVSGDKLLVALKSNHHTLL